jgi:glycerol kinase
VLSWQDLRTVIDCLVLQGAGLRLAPNVTATKAKWLLEHCARTPDVRIATLDAFVVWHLTRGAHFVTDHSNAGFTGLVDASVSWNPSVTELVGVDVAMLPAIEPSMWSHGRASALEGAPPITAIVGDQSAALFGQGCVRQGLKITFGTGAMLDAIDDDVPTSMQRNASGCYPIVARSSAHGLVWASEAVALTAGTCIEWLRDALGLISSAEETEVLARSVDSTDGVSFVPALAGLGTPQWDFGARGAFFGMTRGTTKAHLVRAVVEGIAHQGADLVAAATVQLNHPLTEIRVDGGMTANRFFVEMLANTTGVPIAISSEREATTRGVGLMALVGAGYLSEDDVAASWQPAEVIVPTWDDTQRSTERARWASAVGRAERTIPELSNVTF